jgi:hypothetical protein
VRVLYVSDFDPGGLSMPLAVARKAEFYIRRSEAEFDIQVRPVALTHEQCLHYRLPRIPLKDTELRAAKFEARFGEGATELDALEALRPGELRNILVREVERYFDTTLDRRLARVIHKVESDLSRINQRARDRHADALEALEEKRQRIVEVIEDMRNRIDEMEGELEAEAQPVFDAIKQEMEAERPSADAYDWPEPEEGNEDPDPLFDSRRSYFDQLARYREHQGRSEPVPRQFTCEICGKSFISRRPAKVCSPACRTQRWRRQQAFK